MKSLPCQLVSVATIVDLRVDPSTEIGAILGQSVCKRARTTEAIVSASRSRSGLVAQAREWRGRSCAVGAAGDIAARSLPLRAVSPEPPRRRGERGAGDRVPGTLRTR